MFLLYDEDDFLHKFQTMEDLKEYIEIRHAEEGGFDWISEITDYEVDSMDVVGF